MVTCNICGSENFEKHAGFLYCAVCQNQSQDYHEQEYDYHDHNINTIRSKKSPGSHLKKKQKFQDDGMWTTWEAFNYILHGMTEEMKKLGGTKEFELMVFKLWAAYLRECEAVFTSKHEEKIPKLGYNFRERDARILYNVDVSSNTFRAGKARTKSSSKLSSSFSASFSSQTKSSIALQRGKIIEADYQEVLSCSAQSSTLLADETLESLGRSSDGDMSLDSSGVSDSLLGNFKEMLRKKDFKLYKSCYSSEGLKAKYRDKCKRDIKFPGKNKLLGIIHLALLLTQSNIQLSDLFRFIREGHLSFAKVTHFFPKEMKLPKRDFCYIEVTSDSLMPTHLRQRKIGGQLARLLRVGRLPVGDVGALVDRYCEELNLPEEIGRHSKRVLEKCMPSSVVPRKKSPLPSYEAWAMVSIIFVMKLLLGLNDRSEIFLSDLARHVNSSESTTQSLFVFEDWQKFIECRKSILSDFHYGTLEQLNGSSFQSSDKFLHVMMKESKDEHRNGRFVPYSKYYMEEKVINGIKKMLNELSKPQEINFFQFQPSLTPQSSYVETIIKNSLQNEKVAKENFYLPSKFPSAILQQKFKNCSLEFAFEPKSFFSLLKDKKSEFMIKFGISEESHLGEFSCKCNGKSKENEGILFGCSSNYWTLKYPRGASGQLGHFKEEVLEKTPKNFQWLIKECGRMLEMNVRDIYDELLRLEKTFDPKEKEEIFRPEINFTRNKKKKSVGWEIFREKSFEANRKQTENLVSAEDTDGMKEEAEAEAEEKMQVT